MALTVAEIDAAIASINNDGQEYVLADREIKQARLSELLEARKIAAAQEASDSRVMFQRVRMGRLQ